MQFGDPSELIALKVEKGQIYALAEFLDQLLHDIEVNNEDVPLALELIEPIEPAWTVSNIGVAYQEAEGLFVVIAEELVEPGEKHEPSTAQLHLSPGQVQAFIERSRDLVAAGRPPCTFCGRPIDGSDAWCPCHN